MPQIASPLSFTIMSVKATYYLPSIKIVINEELFGIKDTILPYYCVGPEYGLCIVSPPRSMWTVYSVLPPAWAGSVLCCHKSMWTLHSVVTCVCGLYMEFSCHQSMWTLYGVANIVWWLWIALPPYYEDSKLCCQKSMRTLYCIATRVWWFCIILPPEYEDCALCCQ